MTVGQTKALHQAIGGLGAGIAYVIITKLPLGPDLKVPLLALLVAAIIKVAGMLLANLDAQPPAGS